jgi:hypothetical protein
MSKRSAKSSYSEDPPATDNKARIDVWTHIFFMAIAETPKMIKNFKAVWSGKMTKGRI